MNQTAETATATGSPVAAHRVCTGRQFVSPGFYRLIIGLLLVVDGPSLFAQTREAWIGDLTSDPTLIGKKVAVYGRFNARLGNDRIRLRNSALDFRLPESLSARFSAIPKFVRLEGRLRKQRDRLVFDVTAMEKADSEFARFQAAANLLGRRDIRGWDRLAEKARLEAAFYKDKQLGDLVTSFKIKAFYARELSLNKSEFEELLALEPLATKLSLGKAEIRRLRHTALRWEFERHQRTADPAAYLKFADRIAALLPSAKTPSKVTGDEEYAKKPVETYQRQPERRDQFDRLFWVEVHIARLAQAARSPTADLLRLAEWVGKEIPELPEPRLRLLKMYGDREFDRIARENRVPLSHVRRVAQLFLTDLKQPERADQLLRNWLGNRKRALSSRDAQGRFRLARDYLADLNDHETAVELLKQALRISPNFPDAKNLMAELGYRQTERGWIQSDPTKTPQAALPRKTLPEVGMTRQEVRKLLVPDPRQVMRVGTAKGVIEQWRFLGPTEIYVLFRDGVVIRVHTRRR